MDYGIIKETLASIFEEVAFKEDENGKNVSILGKSQENLKAYLEENTSISDDEKAKRYSEFLTNTITNVTVQAIAVAGEAPIKAAQIETMINESVQKILSMKNDDKVNTNNSAVNVAKAKAEIESFIPAQVQKLSAETALLTQNRLYEVEKMALLANEIASAAQEVAIKTQQALIETKKLELMQKDIELKTVEVQDVNAGVQLKTKSLETEAKKLELMQKDIELKTVEVQDVNAGVQLKTKSLETEAKKLELMQKDIELKAGEIPLRAKQVDMEQEKINNMKQQTLNEAIKTSLTREQIRLQGAEVQYKLAQIQAVSSAGELNKAIEAEKNRTQIEVATIYATGRV